MRFGKADHSSRSVLSPMTLHQTFLSLGRLLGEHPELADLKLEFVCPKLEHGLRVTISLVKTTQDHLYPIRKENRSGESLVWNYGRPVGDEYRNRKVLANYPVEP